MGVMGVMGGKVRVVCEERERRRAGCLLGGCVGYLVWPGYALVQGLVWGQVSRLVSGLLVGCRAGGRVQ